MSERDHAAQVDALLQMVQALESDVSKVGAALSKGAALDSLHEPASIKSRLKDLEQEFAMLPT